MCGIAGIFRRGAGPFPAAQQNEDRAAVRAMLGAIAHRGPDDEGIECLGRATLGVRRLSILDVEGGHQPLADAGGRVWAAQNGEIYNFPALRAELAARHPLKTRTDTELLPYLFLERGAACVEALSGMFALSVFDTRDETLLLARDPLGVKPLYVADLGDRIAYASEMKALLTLPGVARDLDVRGVERFLALGFVPGARTVFRSIRKVRPGTRWIAAPGRTRVERYWEWPRFMEAPAGTLPEGAALEDAVSGMLAESVRSMLLSDRPLGILLSGGVDSSLIVALLPEEIRRTTRTFAIGFNGSGYHDERRHARSVAEHLGTVHREFGVDLDVGRELAAVARFLDEPCADPAAVPAHLVARAAAAEVTVLLSGTGGDEVFGGYRRHRMGRMLDRVRWVPRRLARGGARLLGERDQNRRTPGAEQLVMARKLLEARGRETFFAAYLSAFEPASPARWRPALAPGLDPAAVPAALWEELCAEVAAPPRSSEAVAFTIDHLFYLPDDLLLKEDRMTMGVSVEGRVPFLDPDLVRFAAGLPLATRFGGGEGKRLLRSIARRHLPPEIADRRKHGFSVPVEELFRGPLGDMAADLFAGGGSGVFQPGVLADWLAGHRAMRDRSGPLWAALSFELWWREVRSVPPVRPAAAGVSGDG